MSINLSSTTPPAPVGFVLVSFQKDVSGNISAFVGLAPTKITVAPVANVVTIDASLGNSFFISVTDVISSMSIVNATDGQEITLLFSQDASGHAVTPATNLLGPFSISVGANQQSCYKWTFNLADGNWYQIGANGM